MQNILLLGADPATVSLCRTHFEKAGVSLASAEIVQPIGDFIRLAEPAAVLLDLSRTPAGSEILVQTIRSQPDLRDLPLFLLSDGSDPEEGKPAEPPGIDQVFPKQPSAVGRLVEAVRQALRPPDKLEAPSSPAEGGTDTPSLEPVHAEVSVPGSAASEEATSQIRQLSEAFRAFCAAGVPERVALLAKMQDQIRNLRRTFITANRQVLTAFSSALARLLITLSKDLARVNASSLRTISAALDALNLASASDPRKPDFESSAVRVLVVDDDSLSRRALLFALSCPDLELADCESVEEALSCLETNELDVIFTDMKMAGKGEFATQIHSLPNHGDTPLILVTALPDFDARVQSALSGGCDLIAKPFTPSEMVVKAFTFALKRRLGHMTVKRPAPLPPATSGVPGPDPLDKSAGSDRPQPRQAAPVGPAPTACTKAADDALPALRLQNDATAELNERLKALRDELAAKQSVLETEQRLRAEAQEQLQDASSRLVKAEAALAESARAIQELTVAKAGLEAGAKESEARLRETEKQLEQEWEARALDERKINTLTQRVAELEAALSDQQSERERLEIENNTMRTGEQTLKNQMLQQESTIQNLHDSLNQAGTLLEQEMEHRAAAEQKAKGLADRQCALEREKADLAAKLSRLPAADANGGGQGSSDSAQVNGVLQREFEDSAAYEVVTNELTRVRSQLLDERLNRQRLESEISEFEASKAELSKKLNAVCQRDLAQQQTIQGLESKLQETVSKLQSMESALQGSATECRRLQLRAKELETKLDDLTSQVSTQAVIEQSWRRREAEMQACILEQRAQIASAKASLAAEDAEIRRTKERIQSALCRLMRELDGGKEAAVSSEEAA